MNAKVYGTFFETLKPETSISAYQKIFSDDVYFEDPFHKVNGVDKLYGIFQEMYHNLYNPYFVILDVMENGSNAYLRWEFHFAFSSTDPNQSFVGVSHIGFNEKGEVTSHIDYWDAASHIYEHLPVIGTIIRFVKRKIKVG